MVGFADSCLVTHETGFSARRHGKFALSHSPFRIRELSLTLVGHSTQESRAVKGFS